jgi:hypothetical protein
MTLTREVLAEKAPELLATLLAEGKDRRLRGRQEGWPRRWRQGRARAPEGDRRTRAEGLRRAGRAAAKYGEQPSDAPTWRSPPSRPASRPAPSCSPRASARATEPLACARRPRPRPMRRPRRPPPRTSPSTPTAGAGGSHERIVRARKPDRGLPEGHRPAARPRSAWARRSRAARCSVAWPPPVSGR